MLLGLPKLLRRIEEAFPPKGGEPEQPPLPDIPLMWQRDSERGRLGYFGAALAGGAVALLAGWVAIGWLG
jgi:ubiquinone biosynthesis protein